MILDKRRGKLFRHMQHSSLTRTICKMRHRHTIERADGARNNCLAALRDITLLVSRFQQRQERHNGEEDGSHVDAKGLVKGGRVDVPEVLLQVGEGC